MVQTTCQRRHCSSSVQLAQHAHHRRVVLVAAIRLRQRCRRPKHVAAQGPRPHVRGNFVQARPPRRHVSTRHPCHTELLTQQACGARCVHLGCELAFFYYPNTIDMCSGPEVIKAAVCSFILINAHFKPMANTAHGSSRTTPLRACGRLLLGAVRAVHWIVIPCCLKEEQLLKEFEKSKERAPGATTWPALSARYRTRANETAIER